MATERVAPSLFRRRQFRAPHRRRGLPWRLARPFLAALALVGGPVAVAAWALSSPAFVLRGVEIRGAERVPVPWLRQSLASLEGRHLLKIRLAEIEPVLSRHPWVRAVKVRKELPDRLLVMIEEREPKALLSREDGLFYVDDEGMVFAPFDPSLGLADLPLVGWQASGGLADLPAALDLVERWSAMRPDDARDLSQVEALGGGNFRLYTSSFPFPVMVRADRLESGLAKLGRVLPTLVARYSDVRQVDLRFSRQIVIQPAAVPHVKQG
jgi:cell division septal protein FtsQ